MVLGRVPSTWDIAWQGSFKIHQGCWGRGKWKPVHLLAKDLQPSPRVSWAWMSRRGSLGHPLWEAALGTSHGPSRGAESWFQGRPGSRPCPQARAPGLSAPAQGGPDQEVRLSAVAAPLPTAIHLAHSLPVHHLSSSSSSSALRPHQTPFRVSRAEVPGQSSPAVHDGRASLCSLVQPLPENLPEGQQGVWGVGDAVVRPGQVVELACGECFLLIQLEGGGSLGDAGSPSGRPGQGTQHGHLGDARLGNSRGGAAGLAPPSSLSPPRPPA